MSMQSPPDPSPDQGELSQVHQVEDMPEQVPESPPDVPTYPLLPIDPPKIGDFTPSARLIATEAGVTYLAYEDNSKTPVMLILLNQGASDDPAARDRLAGQVDRMDIDTVIARGGLDQNLGRLGRKFRSEEDDPKLGAAVKQSPWVALAFDQTPQAVQEAKRILAEVDLSLHPPQGQPIGPDYQLHWADRRNPGSTRVWPLPWPGRRERAGRLSLLTAWLMMLLLAALAVLIAILLFSRAPETPPQPPVPTVDSGSGGGSGSPSTQPASPSPSPDETGTGGGGGPFSQEPI